MLKANFLPHLLTIYGPSRLLSLLGNRDERAKWVIILSRRDVKAISPNLSRFFSLSLQLLERGGRFSVSNTGTPLCQLGLYLAADDRNASTIVETSRGSYFFTSNKKSRDKHCICNPDRKKWKGREQRAKSLLPRSCVFP